MDEHTDFAKKMAQRVASLHSRIAKYVFPKGATLTCGTCGTTEQLTSEQCADSLRHGWKTHCGQTMTLSDN